MTIERLSELLTVVGTDLGLELRPDEEGQCCLHFDDDFDVLLDYDFSSQWLQMHTLVGYLGNENREQVCSALLEANLFWMETEGASLGLAAGDGSIFLSDKRPIDVLEAVEFQTWLETFVGTARKYQAILNALDPSPSGEEEEEGDLDDEQAEATPLAAQAEMAAQYGRGFVRP